MKSRSQLLMHPVVGTDIDTNAAMVFLFPSFDQDQGIADWCAAAGHEIYQYLYGRYHYADVQTKPAFSARYEQSGGDHFILIFQTERFFQSCNACTVVIGGAEFVKKKDKWYLSALTSAIDAAGSFGSAPENISLVEVGPELHGVAIRDGGLQNGIYYESFLLLCPVGDRVEQVLDLPGSSGNNAGACSDSDDNPLSQPRCYDYDVDLAFRKGNNPPYRNIEVTIEGTKYDKNNMFAAFKEVSVYRFDGCRYRQGPGVEIGRDKPYYIQTAAFERYRSACDLVQELQDLGYPSYCEFNMLEKGHSIFRIRIGNYSSMGEAEHILANLRQLGYRGFASHK